MPCRIRRRTAAPGIRAPIGAKIGLLIMDESTSALDESSQKSLMSFFFKKNLVDVTVIPVGHQPSLAEYHQGRLILIEQKQKRARPHHAEAVARNQLDLQKLSGATRNQPCTRIWPSAPMQSNGRPRAPDWPKRRMQVCSGRNGAKNLTVGIPSTRAAGRHAAKAPST